MRRVWIVGVLAALVVAGVVSRLASPHPDGLERVAGDRGFLDRGTDQGALLGDYGSLTGIVGVLVVLAITTALVLVTRRRRHRDEERTQERVGDRDG